MAYISNTQIVLMRMFPNADMLQMPSVPPAPQLPDTEPLKFAVRTYQTAMDAMYGSKRPRLTAKQQETMLTVSRQLGMLGILPAEWMILRFRSFAFSAIFEKFPSPPFGFIYSQQAIDNWLEKQERIQEVRIPRRILGDRSREAIRAWCEAKAGRAPWSAFDRALVLAKAENADIQIELNTKASLGEFLWFSQL